MVTLEVYVPFLLFVIVMTGTPGLGNLSMMAIGQTTGFRSSLPFLCGTTVGQMSLNTGVSLGLGGLFMASPAAAWGMKICGMAYIFYLAWKLLSMQLSDARVDKRFTFVEGLFLHPLNPKSWAMSVVGFSQLADPAVPLVQQMVLFVATFTVFQVSFHSLWGWAGSVIMRTLTSKSILMGVNVTLVTIMVGATMYALFV